MNNDAVQRLREPGAWVLLGSAALQLLGGLITLLAGGGVPFTFRAFNLVSSDQFFTGLAAVAVVVVAVLLATRLGGPPTPQARTIAMAGSVLLGVMAVFEALCVLIGLAAGSGNGGIVLDVGFAAKIAMFLYGIGKLAVLAVGGYYVFTVFQSFGPVSPPPPGGSGPYPQHGYAQPPYGGYAQQQPPSAPPPAGPPPASPPPYGQPPQPQQPGFYPPTQQFQQQPPPPPAAGQPQPNDGEWTLAYGQEAVDDQDSSDPYRPPE